MWPATSTDINVINVINVMEVRTDLLHVWPRPSDAIKERVPSVGCVRVFDVQVRGGFVWNVPRAVGSGALGCAQINAACKHTRKPQRWN